MARGHGRSSEKETMSGGETKKTLRRQLRDEASRHSAKEMAEASVGICASLMQKEIWERSRSILFYSPIAGEPNIWPLANEALARGKTVALPRFTGGVDPYVICEVKNPAQDLVAGQFAIAEPNPGCAVLDLKLLDLLLVPGIGFATAGQRLGRGKGYYDRLLTNAGGFKCGVAFDWQVVVDLPLEPHDVLLNCILTPTRWLEVAPSPRF
jgi:5-formyltetrahydrofolate cyclo-ligase